jgi:hypothetical protein
MQPYMLLSRLHDLHGKIARDKTRQTANKLKMPSLQLLSLKKGLKSPKQKLKRESFMSKSLKFKKPSKTTLRLKIRHLA